MNAYLAYWKPDQIDWDDPGSHVLRHAVSQQYHKVHPGDRVYVITSRGGKLYLVGSITVGVRVGRADAASRLRCEPDELWGDHHIFAVAGTEMRANPIVCEDALRELFVVSGNQPQQIKQPMIGQRFQTMRQITPESATILDDLIAAHRST